MVRQLRKKSQLTSSASVLNRFTVGGMPIEPPPSRWALPHPLESAIDDEDFIGVGADLTPGTMLQGYRMGSFGMHIDIEGEQVLAWWSPIERGIIPIDDFHISRSLAKSMRKFTVTFDTAFSDVVTLCREGGRAGDRDGEWINDEYVNSYSELYRLGWAHSVEVWKGHSLVGGLICIEINGLVCGESMASRERDASKVALAALVQRLDTGEDRLLDVQWVTPHLASLGAIAVSRETYCKDLLPRALRLAPVLSSN